MRAGNSATTSRDTPGEPLTVISRSRGRTAWWETPASVIPWDRPELEALQRIHAAQNLRQAPIRDLGHAGIVGL